MSLSSGKHLVAKKQFKNYVLPFRRILVGM
jgi:hypothetical protein